MRVRALSEARRHIGTKESPAGSNIVLFSRWYGFTGPWCAMFVTYCEVKAGSRSFRRGRYAAYVPDIVADARAGRNHLQVMDHPQPGDLVCFNWDGGVADHIGRFEKWLNEDAGSFESCEGNTSADEGGSQSNGGMVARRQRHRSQVECFVRVGR